MLINIYVENFCFLFLNIKIKLFIFLIFQTFFELFDGKNFGDTQEFGSEFERNSNRYFKSFLASKTNCISLKKRNQTAFLQGLLDFSSEELECRIFIFNYFYIAKYEQLSNHNICIFERRLK